MKDEIVFDNFADAAIVAEKLVKNNYVVMLSREERFTILNYVWAPDADRNYVAFGNAEDYYEVDREED